MVREYICFIICTYDLTLQQSSPAIQGIRLNVLRKNSHLVTAVGLQIHGITCATAYIVLSPVSLSASLALMVTLIANLMCLDMFLTGQACFSWQCYYAISWPVTLKITGITCFKVKVGLGVVFLICRVVTSVNRTYPKQRECNSWPGAYMYRYVMAVWPIRRLLSGMKYSKCKTSWLGY